MASGSEEQVHYVGFSHSAWDAVEDTAAGEAKTPEQFLSDMIAHQQFIVDTLKSGGVFYVQYFNEPNKAHEVSFRQMYPGL